MLCMYVCMYLREGVGSAEEVRESKAGSTPSTELKAGLDPTIQR